MIARLNLWIVFVLIVVGLVPPAHAQLTPSTPQLVQPITAGHCLAAGTNPAYQIVNSGFACPDSPGGVLQPGSGGTGATSLGPEFTNTGGSGSRFDIAPQAILPSVISACGAKGDGSTDDRAAFASCETNYPGGFYVPMTALGYHIADDGTHLGVNFPLGSNIQGQGFAWSPGSPPVNALINCASTIVVCGIFGESLNVANKTTTGGSGTTINITNTTGLLTGMPVFDETNTSAVPLGAYITAITLNTSITVNKSTSGVTSGDTLLFGGVATAYQAVQTSNLTFAIGSGGAIPAGSVACYINQVQPYIERAVDCSHASIGRYFEHVYDGAGGWGADYDGLQVFTDQISDAHFVFDGWYDAHVDQAELGFGNISQPTGNAFIRVTGGNSADGGAGPNTILFNHTMFNALSSTTTTLWDFKNLGSGTTGTTATASPGIAQYFEIDNSHVEETTYLAQSDSTMHVLWDLVFSNLNEQGNGSTNQIFNLNSGTGLGRVLFNNPMWNGMPAQTVTNSNKIRQFTINGGDTGGAALTIDATDGASDSNVDLAGGFAVFGGVTVGGTWNHFNDASASTSTTNSTSQTCPNVCTEAATGTGVHVNSVSPTLGGTVTGPDSGTWTSAGLNNLAGIGVGTGASVNTISLSTANTGGTNSATVTNSGTASNTSTKAQIESVLSCSGCFEANYLQGGTTPSWGLLTGPGVTGGINITSGAGGIALSGISAASGAEIMCVAGATGGALTTATTVVGCVPSTLRDKILKHRINPFYALWAIATRPEAWAYIYKPEMKLGDNEQVGLIAESVCSINSLLCHYDKDGQIDNYDKIGIFAYAVAAIQGLIYSLCIMFVVVIVGFVVLWRRQKRAGS